MQDDPAAMARLTHDWLPKGSHVTVVWCGAADPAALRRRGRRRHTEELKDAGPLKPFVYKTEYKDSSVRRCTRSCVSSGRRR